MTGETLAAVDCGTNSTRLLVSRGGAIVERLMTITRLGQGVDEHRPAGQMEELLGPVRAHTAPGPAGKDNRVDGHKKQESKARG